MELEELEVRFKANYSDFFEKTQEMASRVSEQTKSLMDKVQQFSNEYENVSEFSVLDFKVKLSITGVSIKIGIVTESEPSCVP